MKYSTRRIWRGCHLKLQVNWAGSRFDIQALDKSRQVGSLGGIECAGDWDDVLDCAEDVNGGENIIWGLTDAAPQLLSNLDQVTFLLVNNLEAESRGRKIGWLLLEELVRATQRLEVENPLFAWFAAPLIPDRTEADTDKLIGYYRGLGAFNPGVEKQVMLWDKCDVLPDLGIRMPDRGPRANLAGTATEFQTVYGVIYGPGDTAPLANRQDAEQALRCRLAQRFRRIAEQSQVEDDAVNEAMLSVAQLMGEPGEGPELWEFKVPRLPEDHKLLQVLVDANKQPYARYSLGRIAVEATRIGYNRWASVDIVRPSLPPQCRPGFESRMWQSVGRLK